MMNPVEIEFEFATPENLAGAAPVLIAGICRDGLPALAASLAESEAAKALADLARAAGFEGKRGEAQLVTNTAPQLPGAVMLVGLGQRDRLDRLAVERAVAQAARQLRGGEFPAVSALPALDGELPELVGSVVDGLILGSYTCATYVREEERKKLKPVEKCIIIAAGEAEELKAAAARAKALAQATNLARDLANAPGGDLPPPVFADKIVEITKDLGIQAEIWKAKRIAAHGMNLLLAVGQGSTHEPRVVKLTYKPPQRATGTVVLVGKGITFDSGGIDLKKPQGLDTMKGDKAGAAAVVAAMVACAKIQPSCRVIGIIASAENCISGKAYKPGDVFTSASGKTVEIGDTDAEGRLVLADALHYATTLEPDVVIDVATLTGSCMVGLGNQVAGVFSNDGTLAETLLQASDIAGERLWPMPLEVLYRSEIDSEVADLRNIGESRFGDAINAALFLQEHVGNAVWAHLDIAGPAWLDSASPAYPAGSTGYGVRLLGQFLLSMPIS